MEETGNDSKSLIKLISTSTIIASMCCLPSIVLVMFGFASVSSAAALSDTLYWGTGGYWWFRPTMLGLASLFVVIGLVMYFRNRGICTLDDVKRQRRKVVNTSLLVIVIAYLMYLLFNYVILTEIGILFGIEWESSRFWNK
ncbi:MAG: hypothetical protein CBC77_004340 [Euryarchaeota archaeon TMED117]|nr:MAG: hypothetical protein CBC77_004340 [Euryarchaeota archaeon TMED117]|tara:strand:- start:3726 stop:4148 length:423 start_codon:yes stop_codon:yes gene_type:complete